MTTFQNVDVIVRSGVYELMELVPYMSTQYLIKLRHEICDLIDCYVQWPVAVLLRLKLSYINAELARRVLQP